MNQRLRQQLERLYGTGAGSFPPGSGPSVTDPGQGGEHEASRTAKTLGARWVERDSERTLVIDRFYERFHRHAGIEFEDYLDLSPESVRLLFGNSELATFDPSRTLFLDTETTGLSGGAGTYVFLVGVGYFGDRGFRVRQFLMPGLGAESAHLAALGRLARRQRFEQLVTFNGRSFDVPILSDRYVLNRLASPFQGLTHLDLLHPSRLLWQSHLGNCSLQSLERSVLGFHREGDIPSHLIPRIFLDFARSGRARRLKPVLRHNRWDLLSMLSLCCVACGVLSQTVRRPEVDALAMSRFYRIRGHHNRETRWLRRALSELPEDSSRRRRAQWQLAERLRLGGRESEALSLYLELIASWPRPPSSIFEGAAKILEHTRRDFDAALRIVEQAQQLYPRPAFARRRHRLLCRREGKKWY